MVCKEEVLLWFKDLDSYKRIDVLYELLNMCLPFEIRFIGSCIEELGKHTYQELRGPALMANDLDKLTRDLSFNQGILDEGVRHRLLIYLSLLSSRNFSVASWIYRKLLRTDTIEEYIVKEKGKDEVLHSEFLLLFTMALHHPAFNFEHKQFFSRILSGLIDIRENRISAKHSALGYPPGFGYPTVKTLEQPSVPVKPTPTSCGDTPSTAFHQLPGLPHLPPPPHLEFITPMWNRPGFPYGAPEVPPFPTSTMSPLVSQAASPSQSRSTSPIRVPMVRPPPPPPPPAPPHTQPPNVPQPPVPPPLAGVPPLAPIGGPPPLVDIVVPSVQPTVAPPLDQLSQSQPQPSLPSVYAVVAPPDLKLIDEDVVKLSFEEKHLRDILWSRPLSGSDSKPNGIRFSPFCMGKVRPYLVEQMRALSVDGETSLHESDSSGGSSPAETTPPGTPSQQRAANGMPPFAGPMPDTSSPPPPSFTSNSNSSVPYSFSSQQFSLPHNRSIFPYNNQQYRPTFTYSNFPAENSFAYTFPYVHLMYSSPSPFPARTQPGCYNCGAPNHVGTECTCQNIEDITQKKTFQLEYTSPLPDSDK